MRYTIRQTNSTTQKYSFIDPKTERQTEKTVTFSPGRMIAQHNTLEVVEIHSIKLMQCHKEIEFEIIDAQASAQGNLF